MKREANVEYDEDWPFGEKPWPWCPLAEVDDGYGKVLRPAVPHDNHMVNEGNTACPGVAGLVEVEEPKIKRHHDPKKMADLVDWLVSLDEPGSEDRRTVTLNQIIDKARATFVDRKF